MAQPISTPEGVPSALRAPRSPGWAAAALGAAILLGTLPLWFHYGTAVFFEMIASGISACF
jgi:hypothetical protein